MAGNGARDTYRVLKNSRRNFQKPLLVRDGGTTQIVGSRMGPIGLLTGIPDVNVPMPPESEYQGFSTATSAQASANLLTGGAHDTIN